jgi:hypothetical protein
MQEQLTKQSPTLERDAVYTKTVSIGTVIVTYVLQLCYSVNYPQRLNLKIHLQVTVFKQPTVVAFSLI